jgi:hypothetical protein
VKNKSARAAALLSVSASLLATAAHAAPESVTECIPMYQSEGKVTIYALCNATAVNKKWNIKLDENTKCAASEQEVTREGLTGYVHQQGSFTRWQNENSPVLRDCADEEAISFAVEL